MSNAIKDVCECGNRIELAIDSRAVRCRCGKIYIYKPSYAKGKRYPKDKKNWKSKSVKGENLS